MILVRMQGGLGNQLFEVAAALILQHASPQVIKLDGRPVYGGKDNRRFVIPELCFEIEVAGKFLNVFARLIRHLAFRFPGLPLLSCNPLWTFLADPANGSLETLFSGSRSKVTILDGYWQYGLYGDEFVEKLRKNIIPRLPLSRNAAELLEGLKSNRTLAVHVRRGDYVHDVQTRAFHGVCGVSYYQSAFRFITSRTPIDVIYVFSDEIPWAKRNIGFDRRTVFVGDDGELSDVEEFAVMSRCHHFIIANSTFSWWAARISASPGRIVVAPRKWFVEPKEFERSLFPSDWHRLD